MGVESERKREVERVAEARKHTLTSTLLFTLSSTTHTRSSSLSLNSTLLLLQGGHVLVGAPTGAWQLILITRGKACPVSRNYLAAVEGAVGDLDALGVEVLAITADPRDRAEGFVEEVKAVSSGGGGGGGGGGGPGEVGFKMAYGLSPGQAGAWGFYLSEGPCPPGGGGVWGGAGGGAYPAAPAIHPEPGLILLTPDGEVSLVFKSSSAFGWADLRILVEGIRFMQEKGYPIRGTYGLE